jgi:signal transduction histidine kinase/ligand-binding sensor domain-containing protein
MVGPHIAVIRRSILWWIVAWAPIYAQSSVPIRSFRAMDYHAHNQNWAVIQSSDGLIYAANGHGILEYDGLRWRNIPIPHALPVRSLAVDSSGRLYVGANGDFGYLRPDSSGLLRFVSLREFIPDGFRKFSDVWRTFVLGPNVYFQCSEYVFVYNGTSTAVLRAATSFHFAFVVDRRLYVRERDRGLLVLNDDRFEAVPGGNFFSDKSIMTMVQWNAEDVLIATRKDGCYLYDGRTFRRRTIEREDELLRDQVYQAVRLHDGRIAFATFKSGVVLIDTTGKVTQTWDKTDGLPGSNVRALAEDAQQGLWVALENGLALIDRSSPFETVDGLDGIVETTIRHEGRLIVGTSSGIFRQRSASSGKLTFDRVPDVESYCFALLPFRDIVLAATGRGVFELRANTSRLIDDAYAYGLSLSPSDSNRVWIAHSTGVRYAIRERTGRWSVSDVGGLSEEIRTVTEYDGRIWLGTKTNGTLRLALDGTDVQRIDARSGLAAGPVYPAIIGNEILLLSTGGTKRPAAKGFENVWPIRSDEPVSRENASWVWWVRSTDRRLLRVNTAASVIDSNFSCTLRAFDITSIYSEADSSVWIGSVDRITHIDPRRTPLPPVAALIRAIRVGKKSFYSDQRPVVLDPPENGFQVELAAADYHAINDVEYQTRLFPAEQDWTEWSAEPLRTFSNLTPGSYRFIVRARNSFGQMTDPTTLEIHVMPAWHQTWWARITAVLLFGGLIVALVVWRSRRLQRANQRLEVLVNERTRTVRRQNEALERIDGMARAVNSSLHIDDLLKNVLAEGVRLPGVEKATAIVLDHARQVFCVRASSGPELKEELAIELSRETAEARYTTDAEQIAPDVFIIRSVAGRAGEANLKNLRSAKALMVVRIRINDVTEGFLIFDNFQTSDAFDRQDAKFLASLREHLLSAFIKIRILEELRSLNRKKDELIGIAAHDLRNPLTAVVGYADILRSALGDNGFDRGLAVRDAEAIYSAGQHLMEMIEELLDLSSIETGNVRLNVESSDLNRLLDECIAMHVTLAEKKSIALVFDRRPLPPVAVDRLRFAEVVDNLISNAIKFTYPAGQVRVRCESTPAEVIVHVADTGQGLTSDDLKEVFHSFKRLSARPTGGEKSTGLGLAIVKKIVDLHGGRVWVTSEHGKGSVFSVALPALVENV